MKSVDECRAEFVYDGQRTIAVSINAPILPAWYYTMDYAARDLFVKTVKQQCDNPCSSPRKMHERWLKEHKNLGWIYGPRHDSSLKTSPNVVPWKKLHPKEKMMAQIFIDLCRLAKKWISEERRRQG